MQHEKVKLTNPPMVKKRLHERRDQAMIQSDCDRDSVAMAAEKLVEERKAEISQFFQQSLP